MPSFMNMETPTSDEVQGEAEKVHNSLDYLINSLNTGETEEPPRVGWAVDTTMSSGRPKGTQMSPSFFFILLTSLPYLLSCAWYCVFNSTSYL